MVLRKVVLRRWYINKKMREEMDHVQVLKKDIPGRGDRKSKKPEADA